MKDNNSREVALDSEDKTIKKAKKITSLFPQINSELDFIKVIKDEVSDSEVSSLIWHLMNEYDNALSILYGSKQDDTRGMDWSDCSENNADEIMRFISSLRTCGFIISPPTEVSPQQVEMEMKTMLRHTVNESDFNELYKHFFLHIDGMNLNKI